MTLDDKQLILKDTEGFIKNLFSDEPTGHDWWHVQRVRGNALLIARTEPVDIFLVEMAALLHEVDDYKIDRQSGDTTSARVWLERVKLNLETTDRILQIIDEVSFKGLGVESSVTSRESMVVQDADRLDALGAIGIARTFAYGGAKRRKLFDPEIGPAVYSSFRDYQANKSTTINHFYEKLLFLKDLMQTDQGKILAEERHRFMEEFLERFYLEWGAGELGFPKKNILCREPNPEDNAKYASLNQ